MKLRVARNLIVSAVAAGAVLAGAPAAMAATSSPAPAVQVAQANATVTPQLGPWTYYSNYPTLQACNSEGAYLFRYHNIATYKCVEMNEGDFNVYYLYFRIY